MPRAKTGGRVKGVPNKATTERNARQQEARERYLCDGDLLPLDVLVLAMREAWAAGDRAKAVARSPQRLLRSSMPDWRQRSTRGRMTAPSQLRA